MSTPRRVAVAAGEGLVGRFGDGVVLLTGLPWEPEATDGLPAVIAEALSVDGPSATVLAQRLVVWLAGRDRMDEVGFGIAAPLDRGFAVLLRGPVWCEIGAADGCRRLSGEQAVTWVDQIIAEPVNRLTLGLSGVPDPRVHPGSDLLAGYVPGQGMVVSYAGVAGPDPVDPAPVPMPDPPRSTTRSVTLPAGTLTCAEGPVIPLDRCYVLGRAPHGDPSVRAGSASPIQLRDSGGRVSRVHAVVEVDGQFVTVRDPGSAHGTYIAAPGAEAWTRIGSEATPLPPGWSLRLDRKIFVFEPARAG